METTPLAEHKRLLEVITKAELAVLTNPNADRELQFSALKTLMAARAHTEAQIKQEEEAQELKELFITADIKRNLEALTEMKL